MIERFIKNDNSLKKWRHLKAKKTSMICLWGILVFSVLSFSAPILSNNKPIILSYKNKIYFPAFKDYHAKEFEITDVLLVDYRKLKLGADDFSIWPIFKWNPFESNKDVETYPGPPTSSNIFGTDDRGRDVFARILYGFKYSISFAVLVWVISLVIGVIIGGVLGFFGGRTDFYGMRLIEIFSTLPAFLILLIIISIYQPNLMFLIIFNAVFGWIGIALYTRGEFLKNRNLTYVEAAQSLGASRRSLIFKHVLPNSLTPLITFAPFIIAGNVTSLAMLDYLGFGLEVPTPSWGELLAQAQTYFSIAWWLAFFPSLFLFLTLTMLNILGDGVREALDPRRS